MYLARRSRVSCSSGELEKSARKIADAHLHLLVRAKETLPVPQQVNFAVEVDLLLAEIVRKLS
jgi:hypothetical protein